MVHPEVELRSRIFAELDRLRDGTSGFLTRDALAAFTIDGRPLRLIAPQQGIMNPRGLEASISVMNSLGGPYKDGSPRDGVWEYAFEGETPGRTNIKLRRAKELGLEIIYLEQIAPDRYFPLYPVRVIDDHPERLRFVLAHASVAQLGPPAEDSVIEREYREAIVRQRMPQPKFRARVLNAYATQCTVCRLKHAEPLDAAHIIGDTEHWGDAAVTNGLAMCKIHHAAYDGELLGITPDFEVRVNADLLAERDGPMLLHGLQEMHGTHIVLPSRRLDHPDRERLDSRYREFQNA